MLIRSIILCMIILSGLMAQAACLIIQTNVVPHCMVNDSSSERFDRVVERISKLEAHESATSTAATHRVAAVETACEQIRSRIEKQNANNSEELGHRAEAFYATRYKELKDANDRFSDYVDKWLTIIGWVVGFIVPLMSFVFGYLMPKRELAKRNAQVDAIAERLTRLEDKEVLQWLSHRREMRDQARWTLSGVVQTIDTIPRKGSDDLQRLVYSLSCFVLQFYHLIDGCVRMEEGGALKEEVEHFTPFHYHPMFDFC